MGERSAPGSCRTTIAAWQECVRTEGTWILDHRFRGPDGPSHHVLARALPIRDEQGHITCSAGFDLAIGDLEEAREALEGQCGILARVQERTAEPSRQAALLDLAHDAIIVTDVEGKIFFWISGAEATYGFTKEGQSARSPIRFFESRFSIPLAEIVEIPIRLRRWEGAPHTCRKGKQISVLSRWTFRRERLMETVEVLEVNQVSRSANRPRTSSSRSVRARGVSRASLDPLVTVIPEAGSPMWMRLPNVSRDVPGTVSSKLTFQITSQTLKRHKLAIGRF